jgi:hypothetical protein
MTQILHISDVHFEEESADQDSVLAALKRRILELNFDVVVVSATSHGPVKPNNSHELRHTLKR